jgi:predicted metalloprotease with PDZ domain
MIKYSIGCHNPNLHYIQVSAEFMDFNNKNTVQIQLPSWRPGRYELQNYVQNVRSFIVKGLDGQVLEANKITKDCWEVILNGHNHIIVSYEYYAQQLDAGASYVDDSQWYINPCNCLVYIQDKINQPCQIKLIDLPAGFIIASNLKFNTDNIADCSDFHHIADSPFIASPLLLNENYKVGDYTFHIWMKGVARPDWHKLKANFEKFTQAQIEMFGDFPVPEYHFLIEFSNTKAHHGVEHLANTVLWFGPGYKLNEPIIYKEFLGLACHELFHSWNIKSIRPIEMMPYDYSKENYSNLGYVAEGVTTYYGDYMLFRSGVINFESYAEDLRDNFNKHFHTKGREVMTLAQSSFDTWLDGYKPGVPDRKVSMYVKGMIVAFMLDVSIRRDTANMFSLDTVMQKLYTDFAKKHIGYSEQDYLNVINQITSQDYTSFFNEFIWGLTPLEEPLQEALNYVGLTLSIQPAKKAMERIFGIKPKDENGQKVIIGQVYPNSPADMAGLSVGDEILSVGQLDIDPNSIEEIFDFYSNESIDIVFSRMKRTIKTKMVKTDNLYFNNYLVVRNLNASQNQRINFENWSGQHFLHNIVENI